MVARRALPAIGCCLATSRMPCYATICALSSACVPCLAPTCTICQGTFLRARCGLTPLADRAGGQVWGVLDRAGAAAGARQHCGRAAHHRGHLRRCDCRLAGCCAPPQHPDGGARPSVTQIGELACCSSTWPDSGRTEPTMWVKGLDLQCSLPG